MDRCTFSNKGSHIIRHNIHFNLIIKKKRYVQMHLSYEHYSLSVLNQYSPRVQSAKTCVIATVYSHSWSLAQQKRVEQQCNINNIPPRWIIF